MLKINFKCVSSLYLSVRIITETWQPLSEAHMWIKLRCNVSPCSEIETNAMCVNDWFHIRCAVMENAFEKSQIVLTTSGRLIREFDYLVFVPLYLLEGSIFSTKLWLRAKKRAYRTWNEVNFYLNLKSTPYKTNFIISHLQSDHLSDRIKLY